MEKVIYGPHDHTFFCLNCRGETPNSSEYCDTCIEETDRVVAESEDLDDSYNPHGHDGCSICIADNYPIG